MEAGLSSDGTPTLSRSPGLPPRFPSHRPPQRDPTLPSLWDCRYEDLRRYHDPRPPEKIFVGAARSFNRTAPHRTAPHRTAPHRLVNKELGHDRRARQGASLQAGARYLGDSNDMLSKESAGLVVVDRRGP